MAKKQVITWSIKKENIDNLKVFDKNPRKFTEKGLRDLKKSLENCGDANIITVNADNTVLSGHARLQVMKQLGYKEVDIKIPDRLLTEEEYKEIVIRLNANTAGEWDMDKLQEDFDIENLNDWGLDIEFPSEIDDILDNDTFGQNLNKLKGTFEYTLSFDSKYKDIFFTKLKQIGKDEVTRRLLVAMEVL